MNVFWGKKKQKNQKPKVIKTSVMCSASETGKYIANLCIERGYDINTFKLEKLLVLAYGECLCRTGKKLFEEQIEIYQNGPIIKQVDRDLLIYAGDFNTPLSVYIPILADEEKIIKEIISKFGNLDAFQLNNDPRLKRLAQCKRSNKKISDETIKKVFNSFVLV